MESSQLLTLLEQSAVFREYERSFIQATGMPLALRAPGAEAPASDTVPHQNALCTMLARSPQTCAACIEAQRVTADTDAREPQSTVCFAGMREASVPVRSGDRLIGFLHTGEVFVGEPTRRQFEQLAQRLREWGATFDERKLERAYFHTRVLTEERFGSVLRLLAIFAEHLGLIANQLTIDGAAAEPTNVSRARDFIRENHHRDLALGDVARAVEMTTFYFCKTFKKATGLTFTDYLSRVRIEEARKLLLNPNTRVSEVAYESGFQSLTHFNRTFQRVLGLSPTQYRSTLPH